MKQPISTRLHRQLLVAVAAATFCLGAQACGKYDFVCKARKTVEDIGKTVTNTVNKAVNSGTGVANTVVYTLDDAKKTLVDFGYSAEALGESGLKSSLDLLSRLATLTKTAAQDATKAAAAVKDLENAKAACGKPKPGGPCGDAKDWLPYYTKAMKAAAAQAARSAAALQSTQQALALQVAAAAQQTFEQASADISTAEVQTLRAATKAGAAFAQVEKTGIDFAKTGFLAYLKQLQNEAVKQLAKAFLGNNKAFVQGLARAQSLDADGQAALNRIKRSLPIAFAQGGAITEQTRNDMLQVAIKLGLVSADGVTPPTLKVPTAQSSFTIFMGDGGGYVGGANVSYGFTMNLFPEADGSYKVAAVENLGGSVGFQASASVGFGIAWSPESVLKSIGPNLGVAVDGGVGPVGGSVAVSWDPSKLISAWDISTMTWNGNPVPSVALSLNVGVGFPASATVAGGYTFLLTK